MKFLLHRLLLVVAMIPLLLAFGLLLAFAGLAIAADRVLPRATWGNCWTFAVPMWFKHGGYMSLRRSDDIALFGHIGIPHAAWQSSLNGDLRMTSPVTRVANLFLPIHTLLFEYEIWHGDSPHASAWHSSSVTPDAWSSTEPPKGRP